MKGIAALAGLSCVGWGVSGQFGGGFSLGGEAVAVDLPLAVSGRTFTVDLPANPGGQLDPSGFSDGITVDIPANAGELAPSAPLAVDPVGQLGPFDLSGGITVDIPANAGGQLAPSAPLDTSGQFDQSAPITVDLLGQAGGQAGTVGQSGFGPAPPVVTTEMGSCGTSFEKPGPAPDLVTQYNGVQLRDVCINGPGPHHVFVIGDWGGMNQQGGPPVPADKRGPQFKLFRRRFVFGVDDSAQVRVASAMDARASAPGFKPDYILNVGDNFYWAGVDGKCGGSPTEEPMSRQFKEIFENVYGNTLMGIPWLGVLGNHDYGGFRMISAWEKNIGNTWAGGDRWFTPALYYGQRVVYSGAGFSVDYLFVDTNPTEAWIPSQNQDHNICGRFHNPLGASCSPQGPASVDSCHQWFWGLWNQQWEWMLQKLEVASKRSTYQIIVTHFPAKWFTSAWNCLAEKYGIDMHIAGHIHDQRMLTADDPKNFIQGGTCSIVSGGGGGITSEGIPSVNGDDDEYGFVDLQLTSENIRVFAISHGQKLRKDFICNKRAPNPGAPECSSNDGRRLAKMNLNDTFV